MIVLPDEGAGLHERIRALGLNFPRRPAGDGIPDLPADVSALQGHDLARLLTEFSAWLAYIIAEAAKAKSEAKAAKAMLQVARKLRPKDETEHADLAMALVDAEAMADALDALERATARKRECVSREVSRLTGTPPEVGGNHQDH